MKNINNRLPYIFLLFCATCLPFVITAQTLDRYAISASGETLSQDGRELEFTLGETIAGTFVNGTELSQGFRQVWLMTTAIADPASKSLNVNLYPNPTGGMLNIESPEKIKARLFDTSGHLVLQENIDPGTRAINLTILPSGAYYLALHSDQQSADKTLKILKIQ